MKKRAALFFCVGWLGFVVIPLCGQAAAGATDDLFEPVRLIMTKVEIEIYKHLADDKARDEFIADFWKKRDPSPLSEENEFKEDFTSAWNSPTAGSRKGGRPAAAGTAIAGVSCSCWDFPTSASRCRCSTIRASRPPRCGSIQSMPCAWSSSTMKDSGNSASIAGRSNCSTPSNGSRSWEYRPCKKNYFRFKARAGAPGCASKFRCETSWWKSAAMMSAARFRSRSMSIATMSSWKGSP